MRYRRCKGSRSALLALVLSSVLSGAAFAQQKQNFDIPAEAAPAAIQRWAQQSGLQVFAAEDDLRGIRTNRVHGDFGAVEAAQMLVAGTGLEVIASAENTITIRRVRPATAASGAGDEKFSDLARESLMEIVVTGSRIRRPGFDTLQATVTSDAKQTRAARLHQRRAGAERSAGIRHRRRVRRRLPRRARTAPASRSSISSASARSVRWCWSMVGATSLRIRLRSTRQPARRSI